MLTLRIAAAVLVLVVSANGLADASVASSSEGEALGRPEAKMLYLRLSSPGGQHRDLFSMNLDGSRKRRLTWDYAAETSVVWLPDGRRIGYARFDGNNNIVVMNADGSGKRNLTTRGATSPTWSPDGTKIAFHRSAGPTGKFSIRVADADGGNERDLKRCCWPAWSPDGREIAYSARRGVHITSSDGSGDRTIARVPLVGCCLLWSPDGTRIAYVYGGVLHVMNADGTHRREIDAPGITVQTPAWSPDGQWIAFSDTTVANNRRHSTIYLVRPGGKNLHPITHTGAGGRTPAWSPDGRRIAFVSHRDGNDEIYVMNADGSNQRNLSNSPDADVQPVWQPVR